MKHNDWTIYSYDKTILEVSMINSFTETYKVTVQTLPTSYVYMTRRVVFNLNLEICCSYIFPCVNYLLWNVEI